MRVLTTDSAAVEHVLSRAAAPDQGRPTTAPRAQTFVATKELCVNGTDGVLPSPDAVRAIQRADANGSARAASSN